MGTMNLPLSMQVAPPEIFVEMPVGLKSYLLRGFSVLSQLPFEKVEEFSSIIAGGFEQYDDPASDETARLLGISPDEVSRVAGALGLLIAFTTRRTDVPAVLLQGAEAGVIPKESLPAISNLAAKLSEKKGNYKEALEIVSLSKEVAPSFERLDMTVELRFAFEGENPVRSVPIALSFLQTDSPDNRAFFQLRKQDVQRIIEQLTKALHQMESLEKWASSKS